jgi:WXG100 family type VII secretion target
MSSFSVDLPELSAFVERLASFERRAEELATAINAQIDALHGGNWSGAAAQAHRARHDEWVADEAQMRGALAKLQAISSQAHSNYGSAATTNTAMWQKR